MQFCYQHDADLAIYASPIESYTWMVRFFKLIKKHFIRKLKHTKAVLINIAFTFCVIGYNATFRSNLNRMIVIQQMDEQINYENE